MVKRNVLLNKIDNKRINKKAMTSIDMIITLIIAFVTLFIVLGFITGMFNKLFNIFPPVTEQPTASNPITFSFGNTLKAAPGQQGLKATMLVYNNGNSKITTSDTPTIKCKTSSSVSLRVSSIGMSVSVGQISKPYKLTISIPLHVGRGVFPCKVTIGGVSNQFYLDTK